jgi:class 3 adenylate cyclase
VAREERRTVSVLFVDIVGFTALIDQLDPEDVHALQSDYFRTVARVVHRCGGVVEKYIGDAVMAVFGASDSDEYDAYRAVRTGLEIQEALRNRLLAGRVRVRVRVGVATGEAVTNVAACRDSGQALVSGGVVTTAARLQAYAPEGTVVVCAATREATRSRMLYRHLPPVIVAGKPRPLAIWRACGPARGRAATDPYEVTTPLVGRRAELATAVDQLTRAVRERVPRWLSVIGAAGTGKSRLLHELARSEHARAGAPAHWRIGRCPPFADSAYEPLAEMVRAHAGIGDSDTGVTIRRRLAAVLGELLSPADLPGAVDTLAGLLAPPGAAVTRTVGEEAARACQRMLLAAAARQPLIVAMEDLHLADAAMTRFLRELFATALAQRLPLAIVVTYRPELADVIVAAPPELRCTVVLRQLGTADAVRLLRHLLDGIGEPAVLAGQLLPWISGNPLYAQEYIRMLTQRGSLAEEGAEGSDLPIPETVRRIASARLDRLDSFDRAAVQAAAVLGDAVGAEALAFLLRVNPDCAHAALHRLESHGLLVRQASSATGGQPRYAFAERPLRQAAYARLPRAVRADHHLRAAEWLATITKTAEQEVAEHPSNAAGAVHLDLVPGRNPEPRLVGACRGSAAASHFDPVPA